MPPNSATSEFRRGWRTVLGAAVGIGVGISGLLTYNSGLFFDDLSREFGLSRTAYGAAFFGSTIALALVMPIVGRAIDRWGSRRTAAFGTLALAFGFAALSQTRSAAAYIGIMIMLGLLAAPSAPVPFTRAVAAAFDRSRGLALGLTQVGIGLSAAVVPPVIGTVIAGHGWRNGFLALAAIAALGLLPAWLSLPAHQQDRAVAEDDAAMRFAAVRRSRPFVLQLAAFTTMAFAFAGMLSHFVPMLRDTGMPLRDAGKLAGLIGLSVIFTRVVVGWLADRMEPAWLGAASCAVCALGCLALGLGGVGFAPVGAVALGVAMGAEADLLGIMTAHSFPLAAYSRAYARQYAAFMIAGGLSPLWIGALAELSGSYRLPLFVCAAALLVPIMLFARLPAAMRAARYD
jgi:MFS family permease